MSIGYGGYMKFLDIKNGYFVYLYSTYYISEYPNSYDELLSNLDGMIYIHEDYFQKPEVVMKRKNKPNGKKVWVEKKSYPESNFSQLLEENKILIKTAKYDIDPYTQRKNGIALKLLFGLYGEYMKKGEIPTEYSAHS